MTSDHADGRVGTRPAAQRQPSSTHRSADHTTTAQTTQTRPEAADAVPVTAATLAAHQTVERTIAIDCASGTRTSAAWRGVPVSALLDAVAVPPETTHLVFATDDGYRACLDLWTAMDGLLALERDGRRLDAAERPRLVCPGIDGARTVKGVTRVTPVMLPPAARPEDHEALTQET